MRTNVFTDDLVLFTQHLASAVRAGAPLHQTVEVMAGEMSGKGFRQILAQVAQELRSGATLAESLGKFPAVFPDYYLRVLKTGEEAGTLQATLLELGNLLQKNHILGHKLRKVFAYPVAILMFITFAMTLYSVYLVPQFAAIYEEMGAEIPKPLLTLINSEFRLFEGAILGFIVLFFVARRFARVGWCGLVFDSFDLNCPFLGVMTRNAIASRITRALASMLHVGVPLPDAMSLCGQMLDNRKAQQSIAAVREQVERGETLSTAMLSESLFPPTLVWLLSAAEVKGDFVGTLEQLSDFYSAKVDQTSVWIVEILEPLLILVVGGIMVIMATALYAPIFSLVDAVGH